MIVEKDKDTKLETTMTGQKIVMGVDKDSMAHIMGLLTKQYSDTELAIIREYSTNAHDAHTEAGVTLPIEVTTPSALSPFLRVKDYGIGLDVDGIERIYSQYGASTKRGTNDQNGMLGIGCKSALAYTKQFSLVGVKDGKAHTVSISLDDDGVGSMTVVQIIDTDEPNGVEVVIPTTTRNDIERKARQFFRAWKPGTVKLNGTDPAGFDGLPVSDNMLVVEGDQDYVVMGNVAYPVEEDRFKHGLAGFSLVAFVKIGEVNFVPSREMLEYNSRTLTTLQRISSEFKANVQGAIQKQMDAAATPQEAVATMVRWHKMMPGHLARMSRLNLAYNYKGIPVPTHYEAPSDSNDLIDPNRPGRILFTGASGHSLSIATERRKLDTTYWPTTLFVHGYEGAKLTPTQKKKLNKYREDNDLTNVANYALVKDKPSLPWLEHIVDYATIKAIKLPKNTGNQAMVNGAYRIPGSYDLYDCQKGGHLRGVPAADIDQSRRVFYNTGSKSSNERYFKFLRVYFSDCYIVRLSANRVPKFCRHFPKAIPVARAVQEAYTERNKKITTDERMALACAAAGDTLVLRGLNADRVDDPKLKEAIRIAKLDVRKVKEELDSFRYFMRAGITLPTWEGRLKPYPLYTVAAYAGWLSKLPSEHCYAYINCIYALDKGKAM